MDRVPTAMTVKSLDARGEESENSIGRSDSVLGNDPVKDGSNTVLGLQWSLSRVCL
jgi:hypothetical protein